MYAAARLHRVLIAGELLLPFEKARIETIESDNTNDEVPMFLRVLHSLLTSISTTRASLMLICS